MRRSSSRARARRRGRPCRRSRTYRSILVARSALRATRPVEPDPRSADMSTGLPVRSDSASASVRRVESRYDRAAAARPRRATTATNRRDLGAVALVLRRLPRRAACRRGRARAAEVVEHRGRRRRRRPRAAPSAASGRPRRSRRASRRAFAKRMWAAKLSLHSSGRPGCGTATAWADERRRARQVASRSTKWQPSPSSRPPPSSGSCSQWSAGSGPALTRMREHEVVEPARARPGAARRAARSGG